MDDDDDDPSNAIDCEIDDAELLGTKKHLVQRGGPLNFVEALKGKHKNLGFIELLEPGKELKTNKAYFTCTFQLKGYPSIVGTCQDYNKQKARNMAA